MKLARVAAPGFGSADMYWNNRKNVTGLYVKSRTRKAWQGKVDEQFRAMEIPAGARVLDIGGGTGTHAIPLAASGCEVTVIEPSRAMREVLEENLSSTGTGRVTVIPCRWEDARAEDLGGPFDVVMASYSLSMVDIDDAIRKMQTVCRGQVHLFWFLTSPAWARVSGDLWPLLYGRRYPAEPLADCLWHALIEMGICPAMTAERKKETVYRSAEEVVPDYYQRLGCSTGSHETILKEYFFEHLRPRGTGFVLDEVSYGAHIWWHTDFCQDADTLPDKGS